MIKCGCSRGEECVVIAGLVSGRPRVYSVFPADKRRADSIFQESYVTETYRFDRFEVQPAQRKLLDGGQTVAVGARALDLLVALITHRQRLLTKDELMAQVWPGVVVEENNLTVQISTLRKLLGAQAIVTVAGRGYRFTPTVLEIDERGEGGKPPQHDPSYAGLQGQAGAATQSAPPHRHPAPANPASDSTWTS